jgi:hypothetical protein
VSMETARSDAPGQQPYCWVPLSPNIGLEIFFNTSSQVDLKAIFSVMASNEIELIWLSKQLILWAALKNPDPAPAATPLFSRSQEDIRRDQLSDNFQFLFYFILYSFLELNI